MNITILKGRLTSTPELKYTQSNTPVTSFTLAVDRRYKQENGPTADFISCVAWNKTADFITKYFNKGQEMLAKGEIQVRTYTDKQGVKKYIAEVVINEVDFCGPKHQTDTAEQSDEQPADSQQDFVEVTGDDDLPF